MHRNRVNLTNLNERVGHEGWQHSVHRLNVDTELPIFRFTQTISHGKSEGILRDVVLGQVVVHHFLRRYVHLGETSYGNEHAVDKLQLPKTWGADHSEDDLVCLGALV